MRKLAALATGLSVAAALALAPPALAATEFGSDCSAVSDASGYTIVALASASGDPLPAVAPVSGVITSWKTDVGFEVPAGYGAFYKPRLLVMRGGEPGNLTAVGSALGDKLETSVNVYPARLPVSAGDRLALTDVVSFCQTGNPADVAGVYYANLATGESASFAEYRELAPAVSAVIEPDADGDGYGDETQDGCPQSAAYHEACPVVAIDASTLAVGRRAVVVYVAASLVAPVEISGVVSLGKGKKANLTAAAQSVAPGRIARFKLKLSKAVTKRLKELPRSKKLTLKVTASATNVAGQVSTDTTSAKLRGQQKR